MILSIFSCVLLIICISSFFIWSSVTCLYILEVNPTSDVTFTNIFSHSIEFFTLLTASFVVQNFLVWCSFICLFLFLPALPEETYLKILLRSVLGCVLPVFSSRGFVISGLTCESNSFWVYYCMGYEKVVQFDSFTCRCPVFLVPMATFHRNKTNDYKICMDFRKSSNSQNNLEKEQSWKNKTPWFQSILQSYQKQHINGTE